VTDGASPPGGAALVDLDVLGRWMDSVGLPEGEIEDMERLRGGSQNVLLRFSRGGRAYVLRRGPRSLRANSNRVIAREIEVLTALDATDVPHPRVVAGCTDEQLLGGAVFYLMEPVAGFNPVVELPSAHAASPDLRHAMGIAAADALARLGAVDHEAVGLGGFGNPDGYLERQVPRWIEHLESYCRLAGYERPRLAGVDEVAEWLDRNRPASWQPGILHGDYHLGNLLYEDDGPGVAAIVDWEMCTLGDPLLDLGLLAAAWPRPGEPGPLSGALGCAGGLPGVEELIAAYGRQSTRDLGAIDWYVVLAGFKTGIVVEGTYARACAGLVPMELGESLHAIATDLIARALERARAA
jgi:aminoglycoside phosphotransferase (APT) family kinase protein